MCPTTISEAEKKAGFKIDEIDNPDGHYAFSPSKIPAVICPIGPSDRVIKMIDPNKQVFYRGQRYGKALLPDVKWRPLEVVDIDPCAAVAKAKALVGQPVSPTIITLVPPPDLIQLHLSGFSDHAILMMYNGIREALKADDETPDSDERVYGVREFPDWKESEESLSAQLDSRNVKYVKVKW